MAAKRFTKRNPKHAPVSGGRRKPTGTSKRVRTIARLSRPTKGIVGRSVNVQTGRLPFSTQGFYKFPYSESYAITSNGSDGVSTFGYSYNLTGPYDPRLELGGLQPIQWDQVYPQYERYWVRGAKVSVTYSNPSHDGALVGVRVRSSTNTTIATSGRTVDELKELESTRSRWIMNTGNQVANFSFYVRPWEVIGIGKMQYGNIEYSSQTNNNPQVYPVLEPFVLHSVAEQVLTIRCTVRITYYVQMTNKLSVKDV